MIVSVDEAREILGKDAESMSDKDIEYVIETLDLIAKDSLERTRHKLLMHRDALALANLIYDIYQEQK